MCVCRFCTVYYMFIPAVASTLRSRCLGSNWLFGKLELCSRGERIQINQGKTCCTGFRIWGLKKELTLSEATLYYRGVVCLIQHGRRSLRPKDHYDKKQQQQAKRLAKVAPLLGHGDSLATGHQLGGRWVEKVQLDRRGQSSQTLICFLHLLNRDDACLFLVSSSCTEWAHDQKER